MSADNGIFLIVSPGVDGRKEYRVAYCSAIDNIDYHDSKEALACEKNYFEKSKVYYSEKEAWDAAWVLEKEFDYLEYGVSMLPERDHSFPNE